MSVYDAKPWLARYPVTQPASITAEFGTALEMFTASVARNPGSDIIRYFDRALSLSELDELSDAFAVLLMRDGFTKGDRVALYLQNIQQFVIALLGTWKAGGIVVSINPMSRERELKELLIDSGARVLVCLESLYRDVAAHVIDQTAVTSVLTTSELAYQTTNDPRVFAAIKRVDLSDHQVRDMETALAPLLGHKPPAADLTSSDTALLTYTSGTTGPPKAAMTTHGNVVFSAQSYRDWVGIDSDDVILGVAPLFHITGLIGHIALSLLTGAPLVLMNRFHPQVTLETIHSTRATFTVGSITVFIALMNCPDAERETLASLTKIYSGGAPVSPGTVAAFEAKFGHYIHNIYGLTETTSPSLGVPYGMRAPVDSLSGALSIGVPIYDTVVRIVDDDGNDLPAGQIGEITIEGPQVFAGYWNKPEETAKALSGGRLRTGDVGYMDDDGWFYIIDRKKDQINAGGYKIWPREVEDVLYEHPAVREACVVGVPDPYRGETVKAFVSLRPSVMATPEELIAFTRERLAAYKCPRHIEILDEIPKTTSGKILRRELRARASTQATTRPHHHVQPGT